MSIFKNSKNPILTHSQIKTIFFLESTRVELEVRRVLRPVEITMPTKFHEESARRIIDFYRAHENDEVRTVNHFAEEWLVQRTIKRWVGKCGVRLGGAPKDQEEVHQEPVDQWTKSGRRTQDIGRKRSFGEEGAAH